MSNLFVVAYDDVATANPRDKVVTLSRQHLIDLEDVGIVVERRGIRRQDQAAPGHEPHCARAPGGVLRAGSSGRSSSRRCSARLSEAAAGAAGGAVSDAGVNDDFMCEVSQNLRPGARCSSHWPSREAALRQGSGGNRRGSAASWSSPPPTDGHTLSRWSRRPRAAGGSSRRRGRRQSRGTRRRLRAAADDAAGGPRAGTPWEGPAVRSGWLGLPGSPRRVRPGCRRRTLPRGRPPPILLP